MIGTEFKFNNANRCLPNASTRGAFDDPQPRHALHAFHLTRSCSLRENLSPFASAPRPLFSPFPRAEIGPADGSALWLSFQSLSNAFKALQRLSNQKLSVPKPCSPAPCSSPIIFHRLLALPCTDSHPFALVRTYSQSIFESAEVRTAPFSIAMT